MPIRITAMGLPLASLALASFACTDTRNEELAEQSEEPVAELKAYAEGKGVVDQEIAGEVAERRGELARDVNANPAATLDDPTNCDHVYEHAVALSKGADGLIAGDSEIPERDAFMKVCDKLPKEVRACMSVGYAYQHPSECEAAVSELDPGLREQLDQVASR